MGQVKITIIHGQSHKGSTYHIARMLAEKLDGEITEFFLPRDFQGHCVGCTNCFMKSEEKCLHYKGLSPITQAVDEADVLILASPVYVYHVTGPMKSWLDHYGYRWMLHRPKEEMFTKQAVCISTAAGGGTKSTNKDMADSLFFWGVGKIYQYGVKVAATSYKNVTAQTKEKIDKDTTKLAEQIKKKHGHVKPGIKTKAFFHLVRMLQRKESWNKIDKDYWQGKGWDKKDRPWK